MGRPRSPKCQRWARAADRRTDAPVRRSAERRPLGPCTPLYPGIRDAGARASEMTMDSSGWHQGQVEDQLRVSPQMLQRKLWALEVRRPV